MSARTRQTLPSDESRDSQPQLAEESTSPRRLRTRPTQTTYSSQNELGSHSRTSPSIAAVSARPHRSASASRPPTMSHTGSHLTAEAPRLTKTGRISKAKRGVKGAHPCLRPGCDKSYSRAEHLRRHEQNHLQPRLRCSWPRCGRSFSREDLLRRHEQKHSIPGDSRRLSTESDSSSIQTGGSERKRSRPPSRTANTPGHRPPEDAQPAQRVASDPEPRGKAVSPAASSQELPVTTNKTVTSNPSGPVPLFVGGAQAQGNTTINWNAGDPDPFFIPSHTGPVPVTSPWNPIPTHDFHPFVLSEITVDQSWPVLPSTSISPVSNTPHLHWGFEPYNGSFPLSVASSPRSQNALLTSIMIPPTVTGNVPYPLPWRGHHDQYGLELEGLLEEQQLGEYLSLKTKQHYVEAYWKYFHPLFPILHRQTHQRHRKNPLFSAAVMAIGAQYYDGGFAKSDSRILHEKCQELISKEQYREFFRTTTRLDYMQAIFLVELLSHFKAKRAPTALSEVFLAIYDQVWGRHRNQHQLSIGRSQLDSLLDVHNSASDQELRGQWQTWIEAHSIERLLVACYILESQVALLLVRPDSPPRPPDAGSELYMPMPTGLWDASSHLSWAQRLRSFSRIPPTVDVFQALDDISTSHRTMQYDDFTSSLLVACHANTILSQAQADISPYFHVHPLFTPEERATLQRVLSPSPYVQLQHQTVLLASYTPLRALLAVSGESWVLSQKLSSISREAKEKFDALKEELRLWSSTLQPTLQGLYPRAVSPHTPAVTSNFNLSSSRAAHALQRALHIVTLTIQSAPAVPIFGPELGLYYAALILWSITYASLSNSSLHHSKHEPSSTHSSPTETTFDPEEAESAIRAFLSQADNDITASTVVGEGIPSLSALDRWKEGTTATLRWSAWILNGAPSTQDQGGVSGGGAGELMGMTKDVLQTLARRGWEGQWF